MTLQAESQKKTIDEKLIQLIIVRLANQDFGVPIHQVREVIRPTHITPIPDSPAFIAGISSLHGEMVLMLDLAIYFALSDKLNQAAKHILVIRHAKELYGLLVDEVTQIIRVQESKIKKNPELLNQINSNYISGVYADNEERLIMIFNVDVILSEEELSKLADHSHSKEVLSKKKRSAC